MITKCIVTSGEKLLSQATIQFDCALENCRILKYLPAEVEYFAVIPHKSHSFARIDAGTAEIAALYTHTDQLLH